MQVNGGPGSDRGQDADSLLATAWILTGNHGSTDLVFSAEGEGYPGFPADSCGKTLSEASPILFHTNAARLPSP